MYQRAPGTLARRTPGSLVVLAPRAHAPIRISGSSVIVWDLLAEPMPATDLLVEVAQQVGVPSSAVAEDLDAALAVLLEAGAVVVTP